MSSMQGGGPGSGAGAGGPVSGGGLPVEVFPSPGLPRVRSWSPGRGLACGVPGVVGGSTADPPASAVERGWESRLRSWWLAVRPAWVDPGWYDAPLRAPVRDLLMWDPGPRLAAALAALGDPGGPCPVDHSAELGAFDDPIGLPGWPCACMVVVAAAWEAVGSWASARARAALLAAADDEAVLVRGEGVAPDTADPAREELAAGLRVSPASMANRLHSARVGADLPALADGACSGAWSSWTARLLAGDLDPVEDRATAATIVGLLAGKVAQRHRSGLRPWTGTEVRRACARLIARHAPAASAAARRKARSGRRVELDHDGHGMSRLTAVLPTLDAVRIHRRLTALARGLDDPTRTTDQKRADTLADLLLAPPSGAGRAPGCRCGHPGDGPRCRCGAGGGSGGCRGCGGCGCGGGGAQIQVIATLPTLLGLADDPAEVPGIGPVDADTARQLAADGQWRAWLVDAAGAVTATGSRRYTPSPALARLVRGREPTCRMPGCTRSAEACDLDHTVPWPEGPTEAANLGPLCRRHHNFKTHRRWRLANHPDSSSGGSGSSSGGGAGPPGWTWTTPAGITITDQPPPPLPPVPPPPPPDD